MLPCFDQLEPRLVPAGLPALMEISEHWQDTVPAWHDGDLNGDGKVSLADITAVGKAWGVNQAPTIVSYEVFVYADASGEVLLLHKRLTLQPDGTWLEEALHP